MWIRTENGKKRVVVRGFVPYFYVPDGVSNGTRYESIKSIESIEGDNLVKIVCRYPEEVPVVRERYQKHYEANIPFVHRFLIDKEVYEGVSINCDSDYVTPDMVSPCDCDIDYRKCYFDIEVANKGSPITPEYVEEAPDPVICVTIYVGKYITFVWRSDFRSMYRRVSDDWYVVYCDSEKSLLMKFASLVSKIDPDVLIAWNGSDFDIPYIRARMNRYGIYFDWGRFAEFDLMHAYAKFVMNKSVKYVSLKDVVVKEKIDNCVVEFNLEWWYSGVDKLLEYNKNDVKYMVELDSLMSLFNNARMRRKLSGVLEFNDTFYPSRILDSACLREARRQGIALPTSPLEKKTSSYKGANVFQPKFGVYKDVAVFDFSRYYPSIMFSFMLDPFIYYHYIREHGHFNLVDYIEYAKKFVGIGRTILLNQLNRFMRMRDSIDERIKMVEPGSSEYKKYSLMKQAVKAIINSFYGFMGYGDSRLFSMKIAEVVTAIGREGISFVKDYVQSKYGYRVLYGDTDSIMIQVPKFDLEMLHDLSNSITEAVGDYLRSKYGVNPSIEMKFEKYFKSVFFKDAKKRYVYWCVYEGKECNYIGYKGFETVRSDVSKFIKRLEEEMFEIILKRDVSELVSWLPRKVKEFKESKLSDIAIAKGINKSFGDYNPVPAHVRGAIYASTYFNDTVLPGRTVYYLYVRSIKGKPKTNVIAFSSPDKFDEYADVIEVDWDKMIDLSIKRKVEDIFRGFGLSFSISGTQLAL